MSPNFVPIPSILGLFYVVRGLTRRVGDLGLAIGDSVTRGTGEITVFADRTYNPEWVDKSSDLYQDLTNTSEMKSFALDLSQSPSAALGEGFLTGIPYLLLVILVGVSSWLQQKQIQGRSLNTMSPQQAMIMKIIPFMLPIFSFAFPTALIFYFLTSNIFRVGQQMFITKRFYGDNKAEKEVVVPTAKDIAEREKENIRNTKGQKGAGNHGRRPVANPPKKRKKKLPPAETPKKGKVAERKEPSARPHSKRVTPKKETDQDAPGSRRRKNKRKEKIDMEWVEVRGDDVAAAEELALDQLGVAREDAEFEVVTAPENKWLGLKKTEARVRARVKPVGPKSKENNKRGNNRKNHKIEESNNKISKIIHQKP